jgi:hypothetical protein
MLWPPRVHLHGELVKFVVGFGRVLFEDLFEEGRLAGGDGRYAK